MALALRVAEIQAKGHKAFGFAAWHFACPAVASHPLRQPASGMLLPSRLARGHFFPQRPLCDLISASLEPDDHGKKAKK
jgi:hypothetical protein